MQTDKKRLFIFASYDKDNIVDDALMYYLQSLSNLGDIVFTMDNELSDTELYKVQNIPNMLHATALRHGEYDFGSYKRGYQWARENKILDKYDWVYFVNDSVFGPMFDLGPVLEKMEQKNAGNAFGMIGLHSAKDEISKYPDHVQSWFVGIVAPICNAQWFTEFMNQITRQETKAQIVWKYEVGLSQLLVSHGIKLGRFEEKVSGLKIYDGYILGLPFVKKLALNNVKYKTLKKYSSVGIFSPMIESINRLDLQKSQFKQLWKIKLFNKITMLMMECRDDGSEYRLWIFKIIPIRFLRYKDKR